MEMSKIKPQALRRGSRVAAITLSWGGPGAIPHRYEIGKQQFEEEFGVTVIETKHALRPADWIAKNPKARADDLMQPLLTKASMALSQPSAAKIRFVSCLTLIWTLFVKPQGFHGFFGHYHNACSLL